MDLQAIPDPKEQIGKLEQIFHLGQTPTQLFTTPHPQRKFVISPTQEPFGNYVLSASEPSSTSSTEISKVK